MFEYYGNIHVYCPEVGADEPLGYNLFSESLIFSLSAHFMQNFPFDILSVFHIQIHRRPTCILTMSSDGHDLYIHCST